MIRSSAIESSIRIDVRLATATQINQFDTNIHLRRSIIHDFNHTNSTKSRKQTIARVHTPRMGAACVGAVRNGCEQGVLTGNNLDGNLETLFGHNFCHFLTAVEHRSWLITVVGSRRRRTRSWWLQSNAMGNVVRWQACSTAMALSTAVVLDVEFRAPWLDDALQVGVGGEMGIRCCVELVGRSVGEGWLWRMAKQECNHDAHWMPKRSIQSLKQTNQTYSALARSIGASGRCEVSQQNRTNTFSPTNKHVELVR